MLVCVLCLLGGTAGQAISPAAAEAPAPLPDLHIEPGFIVFSIGGVWTDWAPAGTAWVNITVYVDEGGLGNITSANVTLDINGTRLGVSPLVNISNDESTMPGASFVWNTSSLPVGVYPVLAQVNDSAGDADPTDNSAQTNFTIDRRPPTVRLRMDSMMGRANVTESAPGTVNLTGNLSVEGLWGRTLVITLTSRTNIGWVTDTSPTTIVADRDGSHPFSVRVIVPPGALSSQYSYLNISANGRAADVDVSVSAEGIVTVLPDFRFTLDAESPNKDISPGGQAAFHVKLGNTGNCVDIYEIDISNMNDLAAKGWSISLSAFTDPRVQPGERRQFRLDAQSPRDSTFWKSETTVIFIRATSQNARDFQQVISVTFPVYVHLKGSYLDEFVENTAWLTVVILAVVVLAGFWMRRRRKRKAYFIMPGPEVIN